MKYEFINTYIWRALTISLLLLTGYPLLHAQQQSAPQSASSSQPTVAPPQSENTSGGAAAATVARSGDQYRIGPHDVLSIRVIAGRLVPELSIDSVAVNECGQIPLLSVEQEEKDEIQAAGKTRIELAEDLRAFYKKYKKNPQVIVFIKEYNSQPVAINGAIMKPGQFQMRRPVRLLELVQFYAGGPTERSGGVIQLARAPNFNPCTSSAESANSIEFVTFELKDTLSGDEKANPYLQPGDVITLPEAKEAYVVGNVLRPGPILLKNNNVTVTQAIAMAGGTMPDTKKDKVHLIRREPSGQIKQDILVDLRAIDRREAPDIALLPNDIINVEISGGKRLLRSLVGAIVPSVGQLPVRVIP